VSVAVGIPHGDPGRSSCDLAAVPSAPVKVPLDDPLRVLPLDGVCVVMPSETPRVEGIRRLRRTLLRHYGDGALSLLFVVPSKVGIPSDETRGEVRALLSELGPRLTAVAAVIEGTGFGASAKRSVLTFVTSVLARGTTSVRVFATVDPAAEWIAESAASDSWSPDLEVLQAEIARARVQATGE